MATEWTCQECGTKNQDAFTCSKCNAKRAEAGEDNSGNPEETERVFGLTKLVIQAARGTIGSEAFMDGVYQAFGRIEELFENIKKQNQQLTAPGLENFSEVVAEGLDDSYYLFRLALMQFEAYTGRADIPCLRVGMLLADKAQEHLQELISAVHEQVYSDHFKDKQIITAHLASQVMSDNISLGEYRRQLANIIHTAEQQLRVIDQGLEGTVQIAAQLKAAPWLEELPPRADRAALYNVAKSLYQLAAAVGHLVFTLHNPEYLNKAAASMLEEQAFVEGSAEFSEQES